MHALLVDLDDTLMDERYASKKALSAFIDAHRKYLSHYSETELMAHWRNVTKKHWLRYEAGEISFQEQRRHRVRDMLNVDFQDDTADDAFLPYLNAYQASWRLFPEVPNFLIATQHVTKIIVTNGDRTQQLEKIKATGLDKHFLHVITPSDCGSWKPDVGIFQAAAKLIDTPLDNCLMIGDDEVCDIKPAIALGMKYFHVRVDNTLANFSIPKTHQ